MDVLVAEELSAAAEKASPGEKHKGNSATGSKPRSYFSKVLLKSKHKVMRVFN